MDFPSNHLMPDQSRALSLPFFDTSGQRAIDSPIEKSTIQALKIRRCYGGARSP